MSGGRRVAVLGAGSWGTALAQHLDRVGHEVTIWGRSPETLTAISQEHRNPRYFGDLPLSHTLIVEQQLTRAVEDRALVVFAVPSGAVREVALGVRGSIGPDTSIVSTAKGLVHSTGSTSLERMSTVLEECLGDSSAGDSSGTERRPKISVLSGPSFAREVLIGLPTAVTIAARDLHTAQEAASFFHFDSFRVYTSQDLVGVEFGGVLKNVLALAVGVSDGLGMGNNARAAILTRGLLEMQRFTLALGGEMTTVTGLSGLGDLLLTATGDLSRNRQVGLRLGKGEKLADVLSSMTQVAESIPVAPMVVAIARERGISVPIMEEVSRIVTGESDAQRSLRRLLSRAPSSEA